MATVNAAHRLATAAVLFLLAAVAALPSAAQTYDEAAAAFKRGDNATAYRGFRPFAEQGDTRAQFVLGYMYRRGEGVPQDYVEAARWYRRAAEQGEAAAQYSLGNMYHLGEGVPQDYAEAVRWYRRAADQGDASAQNNLGVMYGGGEGVPQDYAEAVRWYRRAADQGNAHAQHNLGSMYAKGDGVPQDYVLAHMWFNLATSGFSGDIREIVRESRDNVARLLSRDDLAQAQRLAREWQPGVGAGGPE